MTETTTTPDAGRGARLDPLIDEHAAEGDEHGRLSEPVVDALHDEAHLRDVGSEGARRLRARSRRSLKVIEKLAYGDPSTGWVTMAAALAIGTGAAYSATSAVDEMFGGERLPVIAGQGTRPGTAVARTAATCSADRGASPRASSTRAHPHARRRRGHRRTADLRPARRAGDADRQLGRDGPAGDRQHRLHDRQRVRARALLALRGHRDPERGGDLYRSASSTSRHLPLRLGAGDRPAAARRAARESPGQAGGRARSPRTTLPRGATPARRQHSRGARADLRDVERRRRDARPRRCAVGGPEHEHAAGRSMSHDRRRTR